MQSPIVQAYFALADASGLTDEEFSRRAEAAADRLPKWLSVKPDGSVSADVRGCTPAELDRRIIMTQLWREGWRPQC